MEWKFDKRSKRYFLSILGACFFLIISGIEFISHNPVPVRLEVDQVKEITVWHSSKGENSKEATITEKELIEPVLRAISEGGYQIGAYPITPRLEMIIKLENGRQIILEEFTTGTSVIFMIHAKRILFPEDMMLHSRELELIFDDFADKIIGP